MSAGGPLRIAAWFTWSGRERSSQSRSPQVPQIRLAFFLLFFLPSLQFSQAGQPDCLRVRMSSATPSSLSSVPYLFALFLEKPPVFIMVFTTEMTILTILSSWCVYS